MNFKSFNFNVVVRIIFLAASMMAFFYAFYQDKWYVTTGVTGLLIPLFAYSLIHYINRFRKDLSLFLMALKNREYSQYQKESLTRKTSELENAFHVIAKELQDVSIEKEAHYHYLQALVENINIGIISYKASGEIHLFNKSATRLLNMHVPPHIENIKTYHPKLYGIIDKISSRGKDILTLTREDEILKIAVQVKEFKQQGQNYKLVSLQDIRSELDAQELESYQKLIQVLRHEIMNSATPISSLSEAVKESLEELLDNKEMKPDAIMEELNDLLISIRTINTRTNGLLKFINNYRKLTNIPPPSINQMDLREVVRHSIRLLDNEFKDRNIHIDANLPDEPLTVKFDFDQISQVIMNILLNAIDAINEKPEGQISVSTEKSGKGSIRIRITDNGKGIMNGEAGKIFIPFYTTKKHGSGIGLSLARKIMKMHRGDIQLYNNSIEGATCELYFE